MFILLQNGRMLLWLKITPHLAPCSLVFLSVISVFKEPWSQPLTRIVAWFVNFYDFCHPQGRHFRWGNSASVSHRLAEVWHPALRRVSPTHSAATPEDQSLQKTMNLHHRNIPWLFGERGQSLGRIHASPVALTQHSHSLTRKWTISRTMRWVSRFHSHFYLS